MPIDPTHILGQVERAIGLMPAAVLVIVMLAGPTLAWLLYRFVVQPRTRRYADHSLDVFWVCEDCRSANDVRDARCYLCGLDRDVTMAGGVRVLDAGGALLLAPDAGETATPHVVTAAEADPPADATTSAAAGATKPPVDGAKPRRMVAVGPGTGPSVRGSKPAASKTGSTSSKSRSSTASGRAPVPVMDPDMPAPVVLEESAAVPAGAAPTAPTRKRRRAAATPDAPEPGA